MSYSFDHILFPTDFSPNAHQALPFAAKIAQRTGATLTLLHVRQELLDIKPGVGSHKEKTTLDSPFEGIIHELRNDERYTDLDLNTIVVKGTPLKNILSQIDEQHPDLIVMGTKGATGKRTTLLGSVTSAVINESEIPVLAVPKNSSIDSLDHLTFTTNYKEGDLSALGQTTHFAQLFNAGVDILHITDRQDLESEIKFRGFRELAQDQIAYKELNFQQVYEYDFFPGVAEYLSEHSKTTLVMVRYQKTFWEKLMNRSHAKEMAFYSKVPLLVLIGDRPKY